MYLHFKNLEIWKFIFNRSVQVFYPKNAVENANIYWYWSEVQLAKNLPNDMIHDLTRSTVDGSILDDYVLLDKYRKGRYLQVVTTTGIMTIAEVLMTFAGMREPRDERNVSSILYPQFPSDATPPLKDCSEVKSFGAIEPGFYQLDTSGDNNNTDAPLVPCEDGWTQILIREPVCCPIRDPFRRNYQDFVDGFSIGGEFWMGLRRASE